MRLIRMIMDHVLGRKYYANVVNTVGTERLEMASYIFATRQDAERHREQLMGTLSYRVVLTVSFRSRWKLKTVKY